MNQNPSQMFEVPQNRPRDTIFVRHPYETLGYPLIGNKVPDPKPVKKTMIYSVPSDEYIPGHHEARSTLRRSNNYLRSQNREFTDCHETKDLRNRCIQNNGLEKCDDEISAHNTCLFRHGFNNVPSA